MKKILTLIIYSTAYLLEIFHAFFLATYALLILGPLSAFIRTPLVLGKIYIYMRVLLPAGLLTRSIKMLVDWRLGNFDISIVQAEEIITELEKLSIKKLATSSIKKVLADFYVVLSKSYLHTGHIDEAMRVVLQATRMLKQERLIGFARVDAQTAHLVRAGIAAGRLLEGKKSITLFVKTSSENSAKDSPDTSVKRNNNSSKTKSSKNINNKIIPFPSQPLPPH